MPAAAPANFRPLLRLSAAINISARQIAAYSYGGVLLDASTQARELIAACRAQNLEVWIDVSRLSHSESARQVLEFHGANSRVSPSASTLLSPFEPHSAHFILQALEKFDAATITGVLYEPLWHDASTSLLPSFPWSPHLEKDFDAARLAALVSNTGEDAARIRQQFWQALNELRAQNLSQLRAACKTKNWKFIARENAPECEALQPDEVLRARMDNSWPALLRGASPAAILRDCYQLLRAGTTRFQIEYASAEYSARASSRGAKLLNEAIERGAQKIAATRNVARITVLFPTRSCQTHYHPAGHRFLRWVRSDLKRITSLLDELHFDWKFISETEISTGERAPEMIVVPSVTALHSRTWKSLERFVEDGHKIACLGLLPRWNENGRDPTWEAQIGKDALLSVEDLYAAYAALEDGAPLPPTIGFPVFREHNSGGRLCCYQPHLNPDEDDARLRVHQILHESITPDFETQSHDVRYSHRVNEGREEFFIFNDDDLAQHVNARLCPELEMLKGARIQAFSAATGKARVLTVWMPHPLEQGGGVSLSFDLAPGEARWVEFETSNSETINRNIESANFQVENFDGAVACGIATQSGMQKFALRIDKKLQWHEGGFIQLPPPILLDEDWDIGEINDASDSAITEYSQRVALPESWRGCRIFLEMARLEEAVEVVVNEQNCGAKFSAPLRFEIGEAARVGTENRIALRLETLESNWESERVLLARLVAYPVVEIKIEGESS